MKLCWCPLAWRIVLLAGVVSWLAGVKSWRPPGISDASWIVAGLPPLCTHARTQIDAASGLKLSFPPPQVDAASGPELSFPPPQVDAAYGTDLCFPPHRSMLPLDLSSVSPPTGRCWPSWAM